MMEKSFGLEKLLKDHEIKYKSKPPQFASVASGIQKRLLNNLKNRRSSRLTFFDSVRNLSRYPSPTHTPVSDADQKVEHRRKELVTWKEAKEKKKKEEASKKKKPFIVGVVHASLKFVPPPPVVTASLVTRSQMSKNSKQVKDKQTMSQSLAPKNASFEPPLLKKLPYVNLVAKKPIKNNKAYIFDPVLPKTQNHATNEVKQTRSKTESKPVEAKATKQPIDVKPSIKINSITFQSSSSSEDCESLKSLPAPQSFQSSTETDSSDHSLVLAKARNTSESPILISKSLRKSIPRKSSPVPKQFTPKTGLPKSESSSEERLRSPKSPQDVLLTPEQRISPCLTLSRGKDNARREMKKKLKEGLLDEDTGDIDNIGHFRRQLASEVKRMTEMCETWDRILEQTVLANAVQECVLACVGQARLLMSQKLQQFASLVEKCARPEPGAALVTPEDLHGFWDMVFMQVENVNMQFKKLEEMRARGWVEEAPAEVPRRPRHRAAGARQKPVGGQSRIKEIIAAARRAKKEQLLAPAEKTFKAGFFCVTSPVRSPASATPGTPLNKQSLMKTVLSNEAKKSASQKCASFAMLRASVLGKNFGCEGVAPLPDATEDHSPVITRSHRKSHCTPMESSKTPRGAPRPPGRAPRPPQKHQDPPQTKDSNVLRH